jgi:hypothetical protein
MAELLKSKYGKSAEDSVDGPVGCVARDKTTILTGEFDILFGDNSSSSGGSTAEEEDDDSMQADEAKSSGYV